MTMSNDVRYDEIQAGWSAYGSEGDKIGDIEEVGGRYLLVTKGLIFTTDLYVPLSAVSSVDAGEGRVYLNVTKDEVGDLGWTEPPTSDDATDAAATTYGDSGVTGTGDAYGYPAEGAARRVDQTDDLTSTDDTLRRDERAFDTARPYDEGRIDEGRTYDDRGALTGAGAATTATGREFDDTTATRGTRADLDTDYPAAHDRDRDRDRDRGEVGGEAIGGGAGALGGAVVGGAVAGPPGAIVGGVVGAAGGAIAGEHAEGGDEEAGAGVGGGTGAVAGAAIGGAVAGPPGAVVGGAVGAGGGSALGDKTEEEVEDDRNLRDDREDRGLSR